MNITTVSRDAAIIDGRYVHYTRMTIAEEAAWREKLARIESQKPRRQSSRKAPRNSGTPSRRQNYAAAVIVRGKAMAELVDRVNNAGSIPFDGEAVDAPVYIHASDMYGVA